ncbi:hypothetical protein BHYA_0146g00270 [Botrytis hyacinthi]|uniref:Uncharacterized protein n=1 Tax=Botrytis hyacinthi TaxID=278943 RepID=A0A4Z1GQC0_9HELO|nr:hypothetical protein BHYA_0146g00270 [Botrytis hyacinthi]
MPEGNEWPRGTEKAEYHYDHLSGHLGDLVGPDSILRPGGAETRMTDLMFDPNRQFSTAQDNRQIV